MSRILLVVDMQNDFIDGALGSEAAEKIVDGVAERINNFDGRVIFTRDTHTADYLKTQEGRNLPVEHCIVGSTGWRISPRIPIPQGALVIDKVTFGSKELLTLLIEENGKEPVESVEIVGLCTDICVIANAFVVKTALPEAVVSVDASLCAGVTEESHRTALSAMKACQINIKNL